MLSYNILFLLTNWANRQSFVTCFSNSHLRRNNNLDFSEIYIQQNIIELVHFKKFNLCFSFIWWFLSVSSEFECLFWSISKFLTNITNNNRHVKKRGVYISKIHFKWFCLVYFCLFLNTVFLVLYISLSESNVIFYLDVLF